MNGHLRLDFKALGHDGKAFDKGPAESTVARHNVRNIALKKTVHQAAHQHVSRIVEGALILRIISGGQTVAHQPVPNDHIHTLIQHLIHHLPGIFRRVCIIAIDHQVTIRLDIPEHGPNHIALALAMLIADNGPGLPGNLIRAIP